MGPGFFYYRRRMDRRALTRLLLAILAAVMLAALIFATLQLRPLLESLAVTRASNAVNRIVSEAVDEAIETGDIRYDHLISFEKDNEGRITAVHSNMAACNRLQSEILDLILTRRVDMKKILTRTITLAEAPATIRDIEKNPGDYMKVVVTMD